MRLVDEAPDTVTWVRSAVACVLTDPIDLLSPTAAVTARVLVKAGERVALGQDLLVLSPVEPSRPERWAIAGEVAGRRPAIAVRSPANGVVTKCAIVRGDRVDARERVVSVAPEGSVLVLALFGRGVAPEVAVGTRALVALDGGPARDLGARVVGTGAGLYGMDTPAGTTAPNRVLLRVAEFPLERLVDHRHTAVDVLLPTGIDAGDSSAPPLARQDG